jgi:hypothetical protein
METYNEKNITSLMKETTESFYLLDIDDMFAIRGGGNEDREDILIEE